MVDVGHIGGAGDVPDGVTGLLLGAHEEHRATAACDPGAELPGAVEEFLGLQ